MARKRSNHEFLVDILSDLMAIGENIRLAEANTVPCDDNFKKDGSGFWTALKSAVIRDCIQAYLLEWRKRKGKDIDLDFIALNGSNGLRKLKPGKNQTPVIIPSPAIIAAWQSTYETGLEFDTIYAFDGDADIRPNVANRLRLIKNHVEAAGLSSFQFYIPHADNSDYIDNNMGLESIIDHIVSDHGSFYNYICLIEHRGEYVPFSNIHTVMQNLLYGYMIIEFPALQLKNSLRSGEYRRLKDFYGINTNHLDVNDDIEKLKNLYIQRLTSIGFQTVDVFEILLENGIKQYNLIFCSRRKQVPWSRILREYNARFGKINKGTIKRFWRIISGNTNSLLGFVQMEEKSPSMVPSKKSIEVLIKRGNGFILPLVMGPGNFAWRDILSANKFDLLKINGELVLLKKKVSKTDLKLRSACIQGNIRTYLKLSSMDANDVILIDLRTLKTYKGAFADDGRLEGTSG